MLIRTTFFENFKAGYYIKEVLSTLTIILLSVIQFFNLSKNIR